jgi:hypothetical protein
MHTGAPVISLDGGCRQDDWDQASDIPQPLRAMSCMDDRRLDEIRADGIGFDTESGRSGKR